MSERQGGEPHSDTGPNYGYRWAFVKPWANCWLQFKTLPRSWQLLLIHVANIFAIVRKNQQLHLGCRLPLQSCQQQLVHLGLRPCLCPPYSLQLPMWVNGKQPAGYCPWRQDVWVLILAWPLISGVTLGKWLQLSVMLFFPWVKLSQWWGLAQGHISHLRPLMRGFLWFMDLALTSHISDVHPYWV